jgi:uncharacterized OB-fold protein
MSEANIITVDKYFQNLNAGKLMGSKCPKCGEFWVTPRRICGKCQVENQWVELSGKGTLATFTIISVGNKAMVDKGYDRKKPYIFAIAKMAEGPMVSGLLLEVDGTKPDTVKIGMPVQVVFEKTEIGKDKDGKPITRTDVAFKPAA